MLPKLKLTESETNFLRAWMWADNNYHRPHKLKAKQAQIKRNPPCAPALLTDIIAAAMTSAEQVAVGEGPEPTVDPPWPWKTDEDLRTRHQEARKWLESKFSEDGPNQNLKTGRDRIYRSLAGSDTWIQGKTQD
jgi:hypothetical protein